MQPKSTDWGVSLSPVVGAALSDLVEAAHPNCEVAGWAALVDDLKFGSTSNVFGLPSGLQLTISGATSDSWLIRVKSSGETKSPEGTGALPPAPTQVRVH